MVCARPPDRPGDGGAPRGEEHLTGPGTVRLARWTPNRLEYDVEAAGALDLVVNQNFDTPWTLADGVGEVFSHKGLLAVHLPAGAQRVTLAYRSRPFRWGMALASAAAAVLAGWWWRERGRKPVGFGRRALR